MAASEATKGCGAHSVVRATLRQADAMYKAKLARASTLKAAEKAIRAIDVSEDCVRIMGKKAVFRLIKLKGVRNAVANIIKQEMLSSGGDATVSQWTVNCSRPKTDVLLMGTAKQLERVIVKMRMQSQGLPIGKKGEYKAIAYELSIVLKKSLD